MIPDDARGCFTVSDELAYLAEQAAASRGLHPSIPDNGDWPRRFRGLDGFLALCGRETGRRSAEFTFNHSGQRRLSAVLSRVGRISRVART